MAVLTDTDLVIALRAKIEQAISDTSERATLNNRAFRLFMGQPIGTEAPDHADIVSTDVNSMVTAVLAQMVISFSTDLVVKFNANDAADEQAAKAESLGCNKVADQSRAFDQIRDATQNALLYRTGYLKIWWDKDINRYMVRHEGIEPGDLGVAGESEQGIERRIVSYDPKTKVARVEVTEIKQRLRLATIANDRFFIDMDWDERSLVNCPIAGEVHYKTRNDLVRMGCDNAIVDQLPAVARNSGVENQGNQRRQGVVDPIAKSMEICRVYEAYAWYSKDDNDNRAYLFHCWLGDTGVDKWLLDPEPVSRVPYASGTAFPIANRHDGESLADKLASIQTGKTEMWRQWIDNVRVGSYGRFGVVTGQVNEDDVMAPKAGAPVRIKSPTSIVPIPVMDVGASIKMALEQYDQARTERGGAAVDMIGSEMQVANDTAHGTERVYASKELLLSYMTRNIAESLISNAYLLIHAELRDGDGGPINLKVGEEWQTVDPSQWPQRDLATVTVGYTMGERMHMAQVYFATIKLYQEALAGGLDGVMVSNAGLYKLVTDWMALNLIDQAETYFIDPSSPAAQKAAQDKMMAAQQQSQQAAELQKMLLQAPEEIKAMIDKYKSDQDTAYKYFKAVLDAQVDTANAEIQGATNVIGARAEARAIESANRPGADGTGKASAGRGAKGNGAAAGQPSGKAKPAAKPN
jgi:hypothetical protein